MAVSQQNQSFKPGGRGAEKRKTRHLMLCTENKGSQNILFLFLLEFLVLLPPSRQPGVTDGYGGK